MIAAFTQLGHLDVRQMLNGALGWIDSQGAEC